MSVFTPENPIRVVMADDHEVVRAGIKRLISIDKSIKIVDEAKNGRDAVELVKYHKPHIAMLDILMPIKTGIEAASEIKQALPNTLVVMLTAFEDSKHLDQAITAGADGYLSKEISAGELVKALQNMMRGERVFSGTILKILNNKYIPSSSHNESDPVTITKREQEILNYVAAGKKNSEIADILNISTRTVESHRYNLMNKLGIKNTAGLVRYAVMNMSDSY